ncbi:LacI family DNA-binding transcriptional regulator [Arenibacter sp. ARW7G5Y1]|uniref:LacI family DNA-binding transcriptional regulator n=1 Tax=Arenibacter sp. ARW7G5Y1 TaxID=2135619 RepID=UPI000D9CDAE2|nr:substrate-binding domain-containing protein [Arenibacter sp. ARW7G5Y1]PXX21655.1 LacI family transcriptional regulator [Arenibacter sp. ARW7G5Y1]
MSVTLKDIATYAGVSVSSVSLVLNGKGSQRRISERLTIKILEAAKLLGYQPNMLARNLRKGSTNTIGFVISDISNAFFIKLARFVEFEALKHGYKVFIVGSDENDSRCLDAIDTFLNFQMDGLIIASTQGIEHKIKELSDRKVSMVLIDRYFPKIDTNYVVMNNWQASFDAVDYLIKKGKRRIATFEYNTVFHHMNERMDGYRAALKSNGIRYDKRLVRKVPFINITDEMMADYIKEFVEEQQIDAIYFQTNRSAIPGIKKLFEFGYEVPNRVAVICFDDNEFFEVLNPPITSLIQPIKEIGVECIRILIDDIKNKRVGSKKSKSVYSAGMIERASC